MGFIVKDWLSLSFVIQNVSVLEDLPTQHLPTTNLSILIYKHISRSWQETKRGTCFSLLFFSSFLLFLFYWKGEVKTAADN